MAPWLRLQGLAESREGCGILPAWVCQESIGGKPWTLPPLPGLHASTSDQLVEDYPTCTSISVKAWLLTAEPPDSLTFEQFLADKRLLIHRLKVEDIIERPVDGANASDGLPMLEGRTTRTIHVGTAAMGHYSECSSSLVGKRV